MTDKQSDQKPEPRNIHEAVLAVYGEVGYVPKKGTVEMAANKKYKFAGESEFIAAIRPAMIESGIYQQPYSITVVANERVESEKEWNGKVTKSFQHRVVIQSVYRFLHAPSSTFIDVPAMGEGMDSGDKAFNKAMTIANKYAVRQLFMIETGDDPDKYGSKPDGGVDDKTPAPASMVFDSADALDRYVANCVDALNKAETMAQVKDQRDLNAAKRDAMKASECKADREGYNRIIAAQQAIVEKLKPKTVEAAKQTSAIPADVAADPIPF